MAADIGARIGIDGEKAFRDSLNAINSQLKNLDSEMKAVVSQFADVEDSEEAAAAKGDVLQRSVTATADKISLLEAQSRRARAKLDDLGAELSRVSQEFGENSQEAIKAQNAYNRQVTTVNKLESQINGAKTNLNKMQKEMKTAGKSAEDMGDEFTEAGKDAEKMGSSLKDAFMGGAVVGAIQGIVSGISSLVESTAEYRKIMGTLEVSSQKAGYTAEETTQTYEQLFGVLGDNQQAATATANLQALGLSQEQLTELTNGAIGAWATYGDSIPIDGLAEAINETIKAGQVTGSFADVLNWAGTSEDDFNAKLAAAADPAERANLVLTELSSQGLPQAAEAWRQNNDSIVQANLATEAMSETMAEFGNLLSPIVTNLKFGFVEILNSVLSITEAFKNGGLQAAFEQISTIFNNFLNTLSESLPQMLTIGSNILIELRQGISDAIPQLADSALVLMESLGKYINENLPLIIQAGLESAVSFTQSIRENAGLIVDGAISLAKSLAKGLADSIPIIIENVPTIVSNIANTINDNAPKILKAGIDIIATLIKGLIESIPTIIKNIPKIIGAIVDTIIAFNWVNLGKSITTGLSKGIEAAKNFAKNAANNIINTLNTAISQLPQTMIKIGGDIVKGLFNGIKNMGSWLKNQITNFCSGVLNGFLDFFGIHSPSRVMRDEIGEMLGAGIGEGLVDSMTKVKRQIKGVAGTITGSMQDIYTPNDYTATVKSMNTPRRYETFSENEGSMTIELPVYLDGEVIYKNQQKVSRRHGTKLVLGGV